MLLPTSRRCRLRWAGDHEGRPLDRGGGSCRWRRTPISVWMKVPASKRVALVLIVPMVLIASAVFATAQVERHAALVGSRRAAVSGQLLTSILNQETGARGFFETLDPVFLGAVGAGDQELRVEPVGAPVARGRRHHADADGRRSGAARTCLACRDRHRDRRAAPRGTSRNRRGGLGRQGLDGRVPRCSFGVRCPARRSEPRQSDGCQ